MKLEGKPYSLSANITQMAIELGNNYGADYLLFVNVRDADVFRKTGGIFGTHTTAEELEKGMRGKKVTFELEYYPVNLKTCKVYEGQNAQKKTALENFFDDGDNFSYEVNNKKPLSKIGGRFF